MALKINNTNYAPIVLDLSTKELVDGTITSIETNVTTISDYAFFNCTELVSIVAANATSVGANAFYGCSKLETVDLRNCVTIGNNAFNGCTKLKTIIVSDKLTSCASNLLGGFATDRKVIFITDDAAKWTQINFTKTICSNSYSLYRRNTNNVDSLVKYFVLSSTMPTINTYSVKNLGLTGFSARYNNQIPAGALGIGNNINKLYLSDNGLDCIGKYFDASATYQTQNNYGAIRNVTFLQMYSDVKPRFCYGLTNLARVELTFGNGWASGADSVETIGQEAFMGCTGLSMLLLPNTLHTIGNDAFKDCFTNATTGSSGSQGSEIFNDSIYWTKSILYIGSQYSTSTTYGWGKIAFGNEYSNPAYVAKTSNNVPATIRLYATINNYFSGSYGFSSYTYFTEYISSNNTVTANIDDYAFYGQANLATIDLSGGNITSIGTYAFAYSGVSALTFGSNTTSIPEHCFEGCSSLTTLDLSSLSSTTTIGQYAFANAAIATLTLGSNITRIPSYCFLNCPITSALTIGSNIAEIEPYAFKQESSTPPYISSLTIDDAFLNAATNKIWKTSFSGVRARTITTPVMTVLTSFTDHGNYYESTNEKMFENNFKRVESIYFTVSDTINNVGMAFESYTLEDLDYLTSLSVPNFASIHWYGIRNCSNLKEMTYRGTSSEFIAALRRANTLPSSVEDTNTNYVRYFFAANNLTTVHCANTDIIKSQW